MPETASEPPRGGRRQRARTQGNEEEGDLRADAASRHALTTLHDTLVPTTLGKIPDGRALLGGTPAASIDFNDQLKRGIGPVFLFVMAITCVLMLVAFGSIVIPATTIALNLLSVGAAYGVMVADFSSTGGALCSASTARRDRQRCCAGPIGRRS